MKMLSSHCFFPQCFVSAWDELGSLPTVASLLAQLPALTTLANINAAAVHENGVAANGNANGKQVLEHAVSLCGYSTSIATALHLVYEVSCVAVHMCVCCSLSTIYIHVYVHLFASVSYTCMGAKLSFIIGYEA